MYWLKTRRLASSSVLLMKLDGGTEVLEPALRILCSRTGGWSIVGPC